MIEAIANTEKVVNSDDANLIAAAPALLEAAKNIEILYAEYCGVALPAKANSREFEIITEIVGKARAAVAKAEGN